MTMFSLTRRFDPVNALLNLHEELGHFDVGPSGRGVFPPVNVLDDKDGLVIRLEVPGVPAENLTIESTGRTLIISGKRESDASEQWEGEFSRSLRLPAYVDAAKADATYKHGVLTLRVPNKEEAQPRQIEVKEISASS